VPTPYWPSSPSANFEEPPNSDDNGDMHYWDVWHGLKPIEDYNQQSPRFMSEFGFQSFPEMSTIRSFAAPGDLTIDSMVMKAHQKNHGGNERILTYMLREYPEPRDFASFIYLSQVQQAEAIKVGAEHLRRNRPRTMGALFWQLNDCWPVASWSSIDYFGRWKALQYYARRFYADLLISPYAHDGAVDMYVVSDRLQPTNGQVHMRLLDFSGKILVDKTQDVQIPAQSSAVYLSVNQKEILGSTSPGAAFLVFDLNVEGKRVSRNEVFFDHMRNLDLPLKPAIQSSIQPSKDGYAVTLQSPVLARNVYLSFGDLDTTASDNYLDLLPGEEITVELKSPATLTQLQQALKAVSLTDAFFDERPSYRKHAVITDAAKSESRQ
jgi:beta-mannosidase